MAKASKDPMESVLANIEKQMGNKSSPLLTRFGNIETSTSPSISFGIKAIDDASYIGGVPRGKMVELYGHESSGKSLLTLFLIANAQKQ
jgi:recombination protein RecA